MERASVVRVHRKATTSREYDAITVCIADLHLSCDIVSDRQIRLAQKLAESHAVSFEVSDNLLERVTAATAGNQKEQRS